MEPTRPNAVARARVTVETVARLHVLLCKLSGARIEPQAPVVLHTLPHVQIAVAVDVRDGDTHTARPYPQRVLLLVDHRASAVVQVYGHLPLLLDDDVYIAIRVEVAHCDEAGRIRRHWVGRVLGKRAEPVVLPETPRADYVNVAVAVVVCERDRAGPHFHFTAAGHGTDGARERPPTCGLHADARVRMVSKASGAVVGEETKRMGRHAWLQQ